MKKIFITPIVLLAGFAASAESGFENFRDREFNFDMLHTVAALAGIFLVTSFILSITRIFLESRIKNKMIEKGVSETVVGQFLQPGRGDGRHVAMKWFLVSACVGLGLVMENLTMPLGLHSIAIMAFSVALGFLGYYFYIKRTNK